MTFGPSVGYARRGFRAGILAAALAATALASCGPPPLQHGYVLSENALEQVPVGSSREQVLLVLGTPSTTSAIGGDEAFYYISQVEERMPIMGPEIIDQRVLAVYFTPEGSVRDIANYGLQDGKVFDFISRRTRTGGQEVSLIAQLLGAVGGGNPLTQNRSGA